MNQPEYFSQTISEGIKYQNAKYVQANGLEAFKTEILIKQSELEPM